MRALTNAPLRQTITKFGAVGFGFFFVKGMVWLIAGWAIANGLL